MEFWIFSLVFSLLIGATSQEERQSISFAMSTEEQFDVVEVTPCDTRPACVTDVNVTALCCW